MTNIAIALILVCALIIGLVWRTEKQKKEIEKLRHKQMILDYALGLLAKDLEDSLTRKEQNNGSNQE